MECKRKPKTTATKGVGAATPVWFGKRRLSPPAGLKRGCGSWCGPWSGMVLPAVSLPEAGVSWEVVVWLVFLWQGMLAI